MINIWMMVVNLHYQYLSLTNLILFFFGYTIYIIGSPCKPQSIEAYALRILYNKNHAMYLKKIIGFEQ